MYQHVTSATEYPLDSELIGVMKVSDMSEKNEVFLLTDIQIKCVLYSVYEKWYAVALLHVDCE